MPITKPKISLSSARFRLFESKWKSFQPPERRRGRKNDDEKDFRDDAMSIRRRSERCYTMLRLAALVLVATVRSRVFAVKTARDVLSRCAAHATRGSSAP